eukprot:gb/GEZN01000411.1/.p1 GENE.gb/GEZN01000411.1/~~gb/GEZN01000411.1/.p1  ORF type:complete len:1484 (+),score=321.21 gb/GEZN01000411.1/:82-4533(+)
MSGEVDDYGIDLAALEAKMESNFEAQEYYEGLLWKKTTSGMGARAGRWLPRYYLWSTQEKKLFYWKDAAAQEAGLSPKGEFEVKDFRSCRLEPAEHGHSHGKFTLLMSNRILELKSNTEAEAKEWVAMLSKYMGTGTVQAEVEDEEPAFSWLPATHYASMDNNNPAVHADLCSRFFGLMAQMHKVPEGTYTVHGKRGCLEVFDIERTGVDGRGLTVTRRSDLHTNLKTVSEKARQSIQNEVVKIKVLEKEVAGLASKIRTSEHVNDDVLVQLGKLLMVQGKHQRRIKELEAQREVQVEVEVDRVITRVELFSEETKSIVKERVHVPLQESCMYVLGGDDGTALLSSVERYDAQGSGWELMAPMIFKRAGCAAAVLNGQLHVMGGHDGSMWLSSVEHFDHTRNQWVVMTPMQFRRQHCAAVVLNGQMYVLGGVDGVSYLSSAERYNAVRNRWELIAQMTSKRVGCAAAVLNGQLYVMGGEDSTAYLNTAERFDPFSNRWEMIASMSSPRHFCAAAVLDGFVYVMGGYDGISQLSSVERYNPKLNRWELVAPMSSKRRHFAAAVLNRQLYVIGGKDDADHLTSVERFDAIKNGWEQCTSLISARSHCAAAFVSYEEEAVTQQQHTAAILDDKTSLRQTSNPQREGDTGKENNKQGGSMSKLSVDPVPLSEKLSQKRVDKTMRKAATDATKQQQQHTKLHTKQHSNNNKQQHNNKQQSITPNIPRTNDKHNANANTPDARSAADYQGELVDSDDDENGSSSSSALNTPTPPPPPPPTPPSNQTLKQHRSDSLVGGGELRLNSALRAKKETRSDSVSTVGPLDLEVGDADLLDWSARGQLGEDGVKSMVSFAQAMTQNFDTVRKQVESGIYTTKRIVAVVRKLCQLEAEYSKKMQTVLEYEQFKLRNKIDDGMRLFVCQWTEIITIFKEIARTHFASSEDVLHSVARKLRDFNEDCERKRKQLLAHERKVSLAMQEAALRVRKGQKSTALLIAETRKALKQQQQQEEEVKALEKGAPIHKQLITNLKLFGNQYKEKFKGSVDDMRMRGYQSAKEYEQAIAEANRRQTQYLREDLPAVFSGMQALEHERLGRLKSHCAKLVEMKMQGEKQRGLNYDAMAVVIADMDPALNISSFVEDWVYAHGPPVPVSQFDYMLEVHAEDIKTGRLQGNPNSVFHTSLERCMELQQHTAPELHVPRILHVMISTLKLLGGLTTEGIFRISADQGELAALRAEIDTGNYDAVEQITSPHLPAALLKAWLRELENPLFPEEVYDSAIELGKERDREEEETSQLIAKITGTLPDLSMRVIAELADLAREIASEENCRENKMTMTNLGVVFAPGLLRCPSEDPIQLLQNAKYETAFTSMLLQHYGNYGKPTFGERQARFPSPSGADTIANVLPTPAARGSIGLIPSTMKRITPFNSKTNSQLNTPSSAYQAQMTLKLMDDEQVAGREAVPQQLHHAKRAAPANRRAASSKTLGKFKATGPK